MRDRRLPRLLTLMAALLTAASLLACQPPEKKELPATPPAKPDVVEQAVEPEGDGTTTDAVAEQPAPKGATDDVRIGPDGKRIEWEPVAAEDAPAASPRKGDAAWAAALTGRIDAYFEAGAKARRLHLQVDKPLYNAGETIWVRVWDARLRDLSPPEEAKSVSLDLLSPQGSVVASFLVEAEQGRADHAFDLGAEAVGGEYTVRASTADGYTEQRPVFVNAFVVPRVQKELDFVRKAYGPGDVVEADLALKGSDGTPLTGRTVSVVARVDGEELARTEATTGADGRALVSAQLPALIEVGDGVLTVMVEDGGVTESITRRIPIIVKKVKFALYPEGGDLVLGVPSRVYFEARTPLDKPADVEGRIVDDHGTLVTTFASYRDGLGRFELTPAPGRSYRAEITKPEGVADTFTLPDASAEGCVLRTFDDPDGTLTAIRASVQCTRAHELAVVATLRGQTLDSAVVDAQPGVPSIVYLDATDAKLQRAQGVARITVFDTDQRPLAERVVYRNRRSRLDIAVVPDKPGYLPRDRVTLTISTKDPAGNPVPADLALSVVDDAVVSYADDKTGHLLSGVLLEPELQGELEDPNYYLDLTERRSALALDHLMGTRGWRRFEWTPVLQPDAPQTAVTSQAAPTRSGGDSMRQDQDLAPQPLPAAPGNMPVPDAANDAPAADQDIAAIGGLLAGDDLDAGAMGFGMQGVGEGGGGIGDGQLGLGGLGSGGPGIGTIGKGGFGHGQFGGKRAAARRPTLGQGIPQVAGALDKNVIRRVTRMHANELRFCYEQGLLKNPNLQGKARLKWVIDPKGNVASVEVTESTLNAKEVEQCLAGRVKNWRFPAPTGGGIVAVNYPFVFRPGDGFAFDDTPPPMPVFAARRVFPAPDYSTDPNPAVRNDFRQTVFWTPRLSTDDKGQATVSFFLSDAVTTFRVFSEGMGGGSLGRDEETFASQREFSMSAMIPIEVSATDRIDMPVTLTNAGAASISVQLAANFGDLLLVQSEDIPASVELAAGTSQSLFFPLTVGDGHTTTRARFSAATARLTDAFERDVTVVPLGFPETVGLAGMLSDATTLQADLSAAVPGTLRASLSLEPGPTASLLQGMEGMLREPGGCFEQTSSSNYPNAMVLSFMREHGASDPAVEENARGMLGRGYDRLVGYEVTGGGYEWFGEAPAHPALTAYGVLEFTDMKKVWSGVDQAMLDRTTRWLMALRNGQGGYAPPAGRTLHTWSAEPAYTNAYITWALTEAGRAGDLQSEVAAQAKAVLTEQDPYLLALGTLSLFNVPGSETEARAAADRLAALQGADGGWTTAKISVVESRGTNLHIETTALAMLALMDAGGHDAAVVKGVSFLMANREGYGRYGATQATILALQALTRFAAASAKGDKDGTVAIVIEGREVARRTYSATQGAPMVFEGLEEFLLPGRVTTLELRHQGDRQLPYTLTLDYRTTQPRNSPNAPLHLETTLDRETAKMGENVKLVAKVRNVSDGAVPMTVARIGFPGGLTTQKWQLEELVDSKTAAFVETRPREAIVYVYGLEQGQALEIPLELNATIPGRYTGPASRAYLYYGDTDKVWAPPLAIEITH